jgi:hypothetical protein
MTLHIFEGETEVERSLSRHTPEKILRSLQQRVARARTIDIERTAYKICARVLGSVAEDWIRDCWDQFHPANFQALAEASAGCLPFNEAFERVTSALEGKTANEIAADCFALAYFRSPRTLQWMEAHPERIDAHRARRDTDFWGRVAALSRFSWSRAVQWLQRGAPLSYVALAAIETCYHYNTLLTMRYRPVLESPAPTDEMIKVLDSFLAIDPLPYVRNRVEGIKKLWQEEASSRGDSE